jgi:hypothetical protein
MIPTTSKLSPQERANNFALSTRQYIQPLAALQFVEGQTVSFNIPNYRFFQKLYLMVSGTFSSKHASKTTFTKSVFDKYNLLRQIRMDINGSLNPYQISGSMLSVYNRLSNPLNEDLDNDVFLTNVLGNTVASSGDGASNKVNFVVELPITTNDRDIIGILNAQDKTTTLTVSIDCNTLSSLMTDTDIVNKLTGITITPLVESYSIPASPDAVPDYSILKIVNETTQSIPSIGEFTFDLPTALTYRKLFVYVATDDKWSPMAHANLGNMSLVLNGADIPYTLPAEFIAYKNKQDYQGSLPLGCYAFDFSTQGIANYGGSKNYIDTERITSFQLKVNFKNLSGSTNKIFIVAEKLARLG